MHNNKFHAYRFLMSIPLAVLIIASCSSNSNKSTNPPPPPGGHSTHFHSVAIQNFAFSPASLSVPAGDTVQWTNNDAVTHTVTSDTGSEILSPNLTSGGTFTHVFGAVGSFPYHCSIHPNMHGSVTVQ